MLRDAGAGEHKIASMCHAWEAVPLYDPDANKGLDFEIEDHMEENEYELLLCSHLSRFVPHTLETIEEVDGEYANAYVRNYTSRKPVHLEVRFTR